MTDSRVIFCLFLNIVVDTRGFDAGLACPGVDLGTGLTRPHVSDAGFMPKIAHFRVVTLLGTVLVVALERLEVVEPVDGRGVSHPLQRLPVCDDPHILHTVDEVQEHDEALLVVGLREPRCVVEETEGCPVCSVVSVKVLQ